MGLERMLISKEQFGQKRLLFSEFVDFTVRDHVIHLADNVHVLNAGEVGFSTKQKEVFVTNANLYPKFDSQNPASIKWKFQVSVPEIRIKGINIEEFYFNRKIDVDQMHIDAPQIKLYQQIKNKDQKDLKGIRIPLPKEIESIAIRQFKLNDGSLKVFSEIGIKPHLSIETELNMLGSNIFIVNALSDQYPEFTDGEYVFNMQRLKYLPKNKNQEFNIDQISFSTSKRQILAKQLSVNTKTKDFKIDHFELNIPNLVMEGFDIDNAYRNDNFLFEEIRLDNPNFKFWNNNKDSIKLDPYKLNLYPYFESFANVFTSKSLTVNNAVLTFFQNGKLRFNEVISMSLSEMRIDNSISQGFMHSKDFAFRIPNFTRQNKLYKMSVGDMNYSTENGQFYAKSITLKPKYDKDNHQKIVGFQSDYFDGSIDSVSISNPNLRHWFATEELISKKMRINGLNMNIYRDKRTSFNLDQRPGMFQDLIRTSPFSFMIDSVQLLNSEILYTERPAISDMEGKIRFSNIHAGLTSVSNIKSTNKTLPDIWFNGSATIMDSCQLNTSMKFNMNDSQNSFSAEGSLSPFNMHLLNPILEPLALISIRSGRVNQFRFSFSANNSNSNGSLYFGYSDLKISVLEKKNGNTKEAKFASFLANSLLLRSNNPRGKELIPDEINIGRDEKRSTLNYLWKSVFSGIRNTLGIKENKQE